MDRHPLAADVTPRSTSKELQVNGRREWFGLGSGKTIMGDAT